MQIEDEETLLAQGGHKDLLYLHLDCQVCRADYWGEFEWVQSLQEGAAENLTPASWDSH